MVMCKAVPPMDPAALAAVPLIQQQPDQLDPFNVPTITSLSLLQNNAMSSSSGHDDIQPDVSEIYFLVMHFLASGPCSRAFGQLWNELLQHKLLPRRFHAWVSRDGKQSNDENDDGASFPLSYRDVEARYPNIEKTHLVKLLQQLLIHDRRLVATMEPPQSRIPTAADAPTLLGSGAFSLLDSERSKAPKEVSLWTRQMRWPHWQADQVHGLMLRELGGGFARHSRAPTSQTACYVVLKPDILVDRIQIIKKLRGHRNAVYCAIFDRTGQYVITGSDDRLVKIWSSETGLCLRSCRGHEGDITDMAVSSGNTLVASASNDCSIRIWRLPDGVPISVLRGHTSSVTAITFSPRQGCEHLLLSTSDDGTCRIWDALDSSRKSRVYMPSPKEPPTNVKGPGVPPPPAPPIINQVICCAFNADGSIFVTGSSDKIARV
jgi:PH-interacting protein